MKLKSLYKNVVFGENLLVTARAVCLSFNEIFRCTRQMVNIKLLRDTRDVPRLYVI